MRGLGAVHLAHLALHQLESRRLLRRSLEDLAPQILREGGGRAQPALVASMLRLADEAGEREQVLETLDLSARALSEVLFAEALLRDDLIDAAGFLLGMEQSGYAVTAELAAQL